MRRNCVIYTVKLVNVWIAPEEGAGVYGLWLVYEILSATVWHNLHEGYFGAIIQL